MYRTLFASLKINLLLMVLIGLLFPLLITAIAATIFPGQAGGSLLHSRDSGNTVIGSSLLGQSFSSAKYFHPRPSAAGSGYCGEASAGANLGPTSAKLILGADAFDGVKGLAEKYARENNLAPEIKIPVDAVTRSASGLDPDISLANALLQAPRVAKERGLALTTVEDLVRRGTEGRQWGILGEPRVNVLRLNIALNDLRVLK